MISYNQRALCVRMICCPADKTRTVKLPIQRVKFITAEDSTQKEFEYNWPDPYVHCKLDEFYVKVNKYLEKFESSEINNERWTKISNFIELSKYKYKKIGNTDCWTTNTDMSVKEIDEELSLMSQEQRTFVSLFGAAFKSDMKNGPATLWIQKLIENLLHMNEDLSKFNILCMSPSKDCTTNTKVETIQGDIENPSVQNTYKEPFSCDKQSFDLSSLSLGSDGSKGSAEYLKSKMVVPAFCILLPHVPGCFPLVVEFRPACQEPGGFVQNIKQMLSKMCFQDVIFGMVISPRSYQLSVIVKKGRDLHYSSTEEIRMYTLKEDDFVLDMEAITAMCNFIYRVLLWSKTTNCMLKDNK